MWNSMIKENSPASSQFQSRLQTIIELLLESIGKVADRLPNVRLFYQQQIVARTKDE